VAEDMNQKVSMSARAPTKVRNVVVERIRQESFSKQQLFSEQPPTFADKN